MAQVAAATRQPFAPLNSSRLQNLTSLKNRQNALATLNSPSKRKADSFELDAALDAENIDPVIFLSPKRSRAADGSSKDTYVKPVNFFLTKALPSPTEFSPLSAPAPSPRRPILEARSPIKKLNTAVSAAPLSAPAGRSPTRKRVGILNRRKTASPFTRIDPPKFSAPAPAGLSFSIDAALSGTIPSYGARQRQAAALRPVARDLDQPESKGSWFFEIHEDTPEEEATNLMEHSTCTLDISSDEESAARMKDQRGKENVPPADDVSQTRAPLSPAAPAGESSMSDLKARIRATRMRHESAIEIDRSPLGDLAAEDFYAEGCDGSSVFLVPAEEEAAPEEEEPPMMTFDFSAEVKGKGRAIDIDALMSRSADAVAPQAVLLQPIEKAEENFELWESGSDKGAEC